VSFLFEVGTEFLNTWSSTYDSASVLVCSVTELGLYRRNFQRACVGMAA
jgi:hypothetical protein